MGGRARWASLALTIDELSEPWMEGFCAGVKEALALDETCFAVVVANSADAIAELTRSQLVYREILTPLLPRLKRLKRKRHRRCLHQRG